MSSYFEGFTDADSANEDCISIKRIYIDLLGNLTEAAVFTQVMFWHGRDKRGKTRLRVTRDDELWIAKSYEEWAEECHITARAARDAIRRITESGLIIRKNYHFGGKKTLHIRVDKAQFEKQMSALSDTKCQIQESIRHDMSDTNDTKRQISPPLSDTKCQLFDLTDTTSTNTTKHVVRRFFVPALLDAVTKQAPNGAKQTRPATEFNPIKDAIVDSFGWSWETMTKTEMGRVQKAAADLYDAGVTPDLVLKLHAYCKKNFDTFGPNALCGVVSEVRKLQNPKTTGGILDMSDIPDDHPDYHRIQTERLAKLNGIAS